MQTLELDLMILIWIFKGIQRYSKIFKDIQEFLEIEKRDRSDDAEHHCDTFPFQ